VLQGGRSDYLAADTVSQQSNFVAARLNETEIALNLEWQSANVGWVTAMTIET
jgi:hypothetical protein